jgi:hypothetical protein
MFIERDEAGKIKGVYSQPQPGYAEEELPDDHPDVMAYLNPPKDYAQLRREAYVAAGVTMEAIAEALIEHAGGKSQKLQQLMQLRDTVRAEIPKS